MILSRRIRNPLAIAILAIAFVWCPYGPGVFQRFVVAQEIFEQTGLASLPEDFSFGGGQTLKQNLSAIRGSQHQQPGLRPANTHATWSATLEPKQIAAGKTGKVVLRADVDQGYHIYPFRPGDTEVLGRTLIVVTQDSKLQFSAPQTAAKIVSKDLGGFLLEHYEGSVVWEIPIQVPVDQVDGECPIELRVGFNTCDSASCDPTAGLQFNGKLVVAGQPTSETSLMQVQELEFKFVEQSLNATRWFDGVDRNQNEYLQLASEPLRAWMILAALAGGFILNFMPCVLPVVGLKLMSFVNQAGNNHSRVITLNLAFVAGIMVVVLMLAGLNIVTKLAGQTVGWGEQFNSFPLQIGIVILLFAMSLSFLGVWEIPIPGFATSSKANEMMQQEGVSGAFYKGILTTLLATPCSGPLLGAVFGETLKLSVVGSLLVFICVGLGLSLPYLAMCIWPNSVRWLPKPGAWMDTLKQALAFPLLLSMVWFLNVIDAQYHIAMLVLLVVVWFACWLVGRVPSYAERHVRFRIAATSVALCVLGGFVSFKSFGPQPHLLPWQNFSEAALAEQRALGKVVMVEFTARWCPTCQTNMRFAIERPEVAKLVNRHQVVTLLADWTDTSTTSAGSNAIRRKVHELESNSIPLLAIYPADPNQPPIVLRDIITQHQLLAALEQAVAISATEKQTGSLAEIKSEDLLR